MEKIYYIINTIDERATKINGFFPTFNQAYDALKHCANWWEEKGTGEIWEAEFGLNARRTCVYDSRKDGTAK